MSIDKIKNETKSIEMATYPIEFLTSFINSYDGSGELRKFIKNCDYAINIATKDQKTVLYKFILTRINGKADNIISCRQLDNWETCKEFLLENFSQTKTFSQFLLELQSCKQHTQESVLEYTQRMEKCYSNLTRAAKAEAKEDNELIGQQTLIKKLVLQAFLIGILPEYAGILRARDPSSFEEAAQFAINEEKLQKLSNANKYNKFYKNDRNDRPRNVFFETNKKQIICYFCNKPGHFKKNCFKYKRISQEKPEQERRSSSYNNNNKKYNGSNHFLDNPPKKQVNQLKLEY